MKNKYTSLELSKKLSENGCELESGYAHIEEIEEDGVVNIDNWEVVDGEWGKCRTIVFTKEEERFGFEIDGIRAYDILNDICVKYAKEFLGDKGLTSYESPSSSIISWIIYLLQKNKKKEAEDYIWEHCKFNPKNK